MPEKHHRIAPQKTTQARRLRREATFPERLLWGRLRSEQLGGFRFRRQHLVGPYVADFYCASVALVVELDGLSHDGRQQYDARRSAWIERQGLSVVWYTNDDVIENLDGVLEDLLRRLKQATGDTESGNLR